MTPSPSPSLSVLRDDPRPRHGPRVLLLVTTMRCNARCGMCTIWRQEPTGMTHEFLEHAFDDGVLASDLEYLGLTGGEPTTLREFDGLAAYAMGQCPKLQEVSFNTNAFLADRAVASVRSLLDVLADRDVRLEVYVSLDGVGEVHDRVRGVDGAFRRVSRTLERLREVLDGQPRARLSLNSVVCLDNAGDVEDTFRHARELDLPINFSLAMSTDVCINSQASDVQFEIRPTQIGDLKTFFARLRLLARMNGGGALQRRYYDHLLTMLDGRPRELPCPFSAGHGCLIDSYGDVYPCGMSKSLHMGSLHNARFGEIWYSEETWSRLSADLPGFCRTCESNCFIHAAEDFHG